MSYENKQEICNLLCKALQATRQYHDLQSLTYHADTERVCALFEQGYRDINVAMDSGSAMIRDIVNHLDN